MISQGDTMDPHMELGDGGSVEVHSAPFGTSLIQMSYIFDHHSRRTSNGISVKLITKKPESPKGVSVSRDSFRGKMIGEKI